MPNVVFIVWDATRARNTSLHGYERETTPFLKELVSRDAVFYEQARAPSSWSLPSHASLFTGLYPREHGTHSKSLIFKRGDRHIAKTLGDNGYRTGVFTNNPYVYTGDFQMSQEFDYNSSRESLKGINPDNFARIHGKGNFIKYLKHSIKSEYPMRSIYNGIKHKMVEVTGTNNKEQSDSGASKHMENFLDWIDNRSDRPFFAFFNFMESHDPYVSPEEYQNKYVSDDATPDVSTSHWDYRAGTEPLENLEILKDRYDGCIEYLDKRTRELLRELEDRGILDDTIVIITSDHGEGFGESAELQDFPCIGHQGGVSEELLHVPLVIRFPEGEHGGRTVEEIVSIKDVYSTILNACDLLREESECALQPDSEFTDRILSEKRGLSQSAQAVARECGISDSQIEEYDSNLMAYYTDVDGEHFKYTVNRDSKGEEAHALGKNGLKQTHIQEQEMEELRKGLEDLLGILNTEITEEDATQVDISSETQQRLRELGYR